jgi:tetratricopeptide (TPR) repeat protein
MNWIQLCIVFLFFSQLNLLPQDTNSNDYFYIKKLIDSKEINTAKKELSKALNENPHDPTLHLYQAEIRIMDADNAYANSRFNQALELYEEVVKVYPSNPLVQARLNELKYKKKNLVFNALVPNKSIEQETEKYTSHEVSNSTYDRTLIYLILLLQVFNLLFVFRISRKHD